MSTEGVISVAILKEAHAGERMREEGSLPEQRTERRQLRLTPTEDALIRQAAAARRMSVTEFMITAAIRDAEQAIVEPRRLELLSDVFDRLAARLEEPERVVDALAVLLKEERQVELPE